MDRLLKANLSRMWKTRSFWICTALSVALGLANFLSTYSVNAECVETLGIRLTEDGSNVIFFFAIFAALFLGTDYSDGTLRNKLVIGHGRGKIYFSNLLAVSAGGLIMMTAAWLVVLVTGLALGGEFGISAGEFAIKILISICAMISIGAIFTLIGMLFSSKSTIVTITLVLTFALLIGAAVIESLLAAPEYIRGYEISVNGEIIQSEPEPNPMYVGGVKRDILKTVNDVLPSGQIMQLSLGDVRVPQLMPLYSLGVLAAFTAVGAVVFRRKDLK